MLTTTSEYWMSRLRSTDSAETRQLLQKQNVKENAERAVKISITEREELQHALLSCNESTRQWVSPFVSTFNAHQLLYSLLKEEMAKDPQDGVSKFKARLETDDALKSKLNRVLDTIEDSAASLESAYKSTEAAAATPASLETVREEERSRKARTWQDLPEDELAERLSKGEIMPRDEWVPGLSEGGRKLNASMLRSHMEFGRKIHKEGNEAYGKREYELALTRFTQGVNLLNWVEGESEEGTTEVNGLLLIFLRNQAQAALQLEQYQTAKQAATEALKLDPHDGKALYRRAQASLALGDLPSTKNDYLVILKSPYCSTESKMKAREGFKEMRRIVTKWKSTVSRIMEETTQQDTFSSDRPQLHVPKPNDCDTRPRFAAQSSPVLPSTLTTVSSVSEPPPFLSLEETKDLLLQLLDVYTNSESQAILNQLRRDADFEERRILIRGKKVLPDLLGHLLNAWNFKGNTFAEQKREMEKCISYWRLRSEEIKSLTDEVYKSFLGDVVDD